MVRKNREKQKAISLRRRGYSYREILRHIHVAKSSLSLWLKDVDIAEKHHQRLAEKRRQAQLKGAQKRHDQRITLTKKIYADARKDIYELSRRELLLMGVMLYWAEGSKEKEARPGSGVQFTNSDGDMERLFIKWLIEICGVQREDVTCDIYLHQTSKHRTPLVIDYWSQITGFSQDKFTHIYFKKNKIKTSRKNIGDAYYGVVKVRVRASSRLCRKIAGWVHGINQYYWGVV